MKFGDYFKELRLRSKMTLRHFCEKNQFDPGNISKLERNILPAPSAEEKLNNYARALGIKAGDDEYLTFFDLARASRLIGTDIHNITDAELLNMLPVLFRTLDNKEITAEKLERIINIIKDEVKK